MNPIAAARSQRLNIIQERDFLFAPRRFLQLLPLDKERFRLQTVEGRVAVQVDEGQKRAVIPRQ